MLSAGAPALLQCCLPQEEEAPSREELAQRDPLGTYSPEAPFWAAVTDARYLTTEQSGDRQVGTKAVRQLDVCKRWAAPGGRPGARLAWLHPRPSALG